MSPTSYVECLSHIPRPRFHRHSDSPLDAKGNAGVTWKPSRSGIFIGSSEKVLFPQFLHRPHFPMFSSPSCECGWEPQTAEYIIYHCSLQPHGRCMPLEAGTINYRKPVTKPKDLKIATARLMELGLLSQLSLGTQHLYQ